MYERKIPKEIHCPIERGLDIFGGKWKSRIICVLAHKGKMRYNGFKQEMVNVTDTALSAALKELATDGMVSRTQYEEIPPRVEYALTPRGMSAVPILEMVAVWAHGSMEEPAGCGAMALCTRCDFPDEG